MDKICGIYKITNVNNNKYYIGSSDNIESRKKKHFQLLRRNNHHSIYLQRAYNKYGESCFIHEIIEECLKDELLIIEQNYLDEIDDWKISYNMSKIASGCSFDLKTHPNEKEIREKISKSSKGRNTKPFYIKEKRYEKLVYAANELGVDIKTISYRLKNWKWKEYYYENKPKVGSFEECSYDCYWYNKPKLRVKKQKKLYYCDCGNEKSRKSMQCKICGIKKITPKKEIYIEEKTYDSLSEASKKTCLSKQTILFRIKSFNIKFKYYHYINNPKNINDLYNNNDIQEKIYKKRKNNRVVIINDVDYFSIGVASKQLNIPPTTIRKRIKSGNFNNYHFLSK